MDQDKNDQTSSEIPAVPQLSAIPSNSIVSGLNTATITPPTPPPPATDGKRDSEADAKYAASLIQMANMKYEMEQANKPKRQRISTKKLIYIVTSIVITIISLIFTPLLLKNKTADTKDSTKQLLDSSNYIQDIEK